MKEQVLVVVVTSIYPHAINVLGRSHSNASVVLSLCQSVCASHFDNTTCTIETKPLDAMLKLF